MNILSIETSCDETAVSIVRADGDFPHATYTILGNALFSQIDIHREYGGVFPAVAKREHAKTLVPMLEKALGEAALSEKEIVLDENTHTAITELLSREPGLAEALFRYCSTHGKPEVDAIGVTVGPGLEPALWVGINFARALSLVWDIPIVPVDHMEGHILIGLFDGTRLAPTTFPALALLISGGHTELVLMQDWKSYELLGETRDDAVGEAFDKSARLLGLPYPGGPEISRIAEGTREEGMIPSFTLPRPMLTSPDYDFSFSGLKTAVLHAVKDGKDQREIAREFEDAATEVLVAKVRRALDEHNAQTLILGGGVAANTNIRRAFADLFRDEYPERALFLPEKTLTTDNAVMIALSAHARINEAVPGTTELRADGNLRLAPKTA